MDKTEIFQFAGINLNQERQPILQQIKKRSEQGKSLNRNTKSQGNQDKLVQHLKIENTFQHNLSDSSNRLDKVIDDIIAQKLNDESNLNSFINNQIGAETLQLNKSDQPSQNQDLQAKIATKDIDQQIFYNKSQKQSNKSAIMLSSIEHNQLIMKQQNNKIKSPKQKFSKHELVLELQATPYLLKQQFSPNQQRNQKILIDDKIKSPNSKQEVSQKNIQNLKLNDEKQTLKADSVQPKYQKQNNKLGQNISTDTHKPNEKQAIYKTAQDIKNQVKSADRHMNSSQSQQKIQNVFQKSSIFNENEFKKNEKLIDQRNSELDIKKFNKDELQEKKLKQKKGNKMYLYHVYKGNYPHQIEKALEIRGVWKKIDVQNCFQLQKTNQIKNPQKDQKVLQNLISSTGSQLELFQKNVFINQLDLKSKSTNIKSPKNQFSKKTDVQNIPPLSQILSPEFNKEEYLQKGPLMNLVANIRQYQNIQERAFQNIDQQEEEFFKKNFNTSKNNLQKDFDTIQLQQQQQKANLLKSYLDQFNFDQIVIEKSNFIWKPFNYYEKDVQRLIDKRIVKNSQNYPLIFNHFEVLKNITTKSGLIRSLKQYYRQNQYSKNHSYSEFDTTPTTFLVQAKVHDENMNELIQRYKQIQKGNAPKERMPMKHCIQNIWLVKPTNMNQGRGIEIFQDLDKMVKFIDSRPTGTLCVVQKYIERPLLYKGRKFDIRIWTVATAKNEVYFYKLGYLRTSSSTYTLDNQNYFVHLTNQCMQIKNKDDYAKFEEGNTLSYQQFQDYLDSEEFKISRPDLNINSKNRIIIERDFIPRMKDIIIDSFCAVKNQLNPNHRKNHFEFFGYDFMIDEDFRVWLIEINTNPYIGTPNEYIKLLVPNMIDEMLNIVLDPFYPPSKEYQEQAKLMERNFELIYQEGWYNNYLYRNNQLSNNLIQHDQNTDQQPNSVQLAYSINQRRPFNHCLLYPIDWHNHQANFQQIINVPSNKRLINLTKSQIKNNVIEGNAFLSKNMDLSQLRLLYNNNLVSFKGQNQFTKCIHQVAKGFQCDHNTCTQNKAIQSVANISKSRKRKNLVINRFSLQETQNNIVKTKKKANIKNNILLQTEKKKGKGLQLMNGIEKQDRGVSDFRANSETKKIKIDLKKDNSIQKSIDSSSQHFVSQVNNDIQINGSLLPEFNQQQQEITFKKKRKKSVQLNDVKDKRFYTEFMRKILNQKQRQVKALSGQALRTPRKNHFKLYFEDENPNQFSDKNINSSEELNVNKKNIIINIQEQQNIIYQNRKFGKQKYLSDQKSQLKLTPQINENIVSNNQQIQQNNSFINQDNFKISKQNDQINESYQSDQIIRISQNSLKQGISDEIVDENQKLKISPIFVNFTEQNQFKVNMQKMQVSSFDQKNLNEFNSQLSQKQSSFAENIDKTCLDIQQNENQPIQKIAIIEIQKLMNPSFELVFQNFINKIQKLKESNEIGQNYEKVQQIMDQLSKDLQVQQKNMDQIKDVDISKNDCIMINYLKQFFEDKDISSKCRCQYLSQIFQIIDFFDQNQYFNTLQLCLQYLDLIVFSATLQNFQLKNGQDLSQIRRPFASYSRHYNKSFISSGFCNAFQSQLDNYDINQVIELMNNQKYLKQLIKMHAKYRKQVQNLKLSQDALDVMDIVEEILLNSSCFRVNSYQMQVLSSNFINGKYFKNNQQQLLFDDCNNQQPQDLNLQSNIDQYLHTFMNSIKNGLILYLMRCANQSGEVWQQIQKNMQIQEFQQILKIERLAMQGEYQFIDNQILSFIKEGYQMVINQQINKKLHNQKQLYLTHTKSQTFQKNVKNQKQVEINGKNNLQRSTSFLNSEKNNDASQFQKTRHSELQILKSNDFQQVKYEKRLSSKIQNNLASQIRQNKKNNDQTGEIDLFEQKKGFNQTTPYFDFLLQNSRKNYFDLKKNTQNSKIEMFKEIVKGKLQKNFNNEGFLSPNVDSSIDQRIQEDFANQAKDYCDISIKNEKNQKDVLSNNNKQLSTLRGYEVIEMLANIGSLKSIDDKIEQKEFIKSQVNDFLDKQLSSQRKDLRVYPKRYNKQQVKTVNDYQDKAKPSIITLNSNQTSLNQAKSDIKQKINNIQSSKGFIYKNSIVSINSKSALNGVKNYLNNLGKNEEIQKQKKKQNTVFGKEVLDNKNISNKQQFSTPQPQKIELIKKKLEVNQESIQNAQQLQISLKSIQSKDNKIEDVQPTSKRGRSTFKIQSSDYQSHYISLMQQQKSFKNLQPVIKQDISTSQSIEFNKKKNDIKILYQVNGQRNIDNLKGKQNPSIAYTQQSSSIKNKLINGNRVQLNHQITSSVQELNDELKIKKQKTIS